MTGLLNIIENLNNLDKLVSVLFEQETIIKDIKIVGEREKREKIIRNYF